MRLQFLSSGSRVSDWLSKGLLSLMPSRVWESVGMGTLLRSPPCAGLAVAGYTLSLSLAASSPFSGLQIS